MSPTHKQPGRRILFVCAANENRSPTAEAVFRRMLMAQGKMEGEDFDVRSAGLWAWSGVSMTQRIADWANEIYVMEDGQLAELCRRYGELNARTAVLDIPDVYERDDPHLVVHLQKQLKAYL